MHREPKPPQGHVPQCDQFKENEERPYKLRENARDEELLHAEGCHVKNLRSVLKRTDLPQAPLVLEAVEILRELLKPLPFYVEVYLGKRLYDPPQRRITDAAVTEDCEERPDGDEKETDDPQRRECRPETDHSGFDRRATDDRGADKKPEDDIRNKGPGPSECAKDHGDQRVHTAAEKSARIAHALKRFENIIREIHRSVHGNAEIHQCRKDPP